MGFGDDGIDCSKDELRTQQHEKDDADVNVIVSRLMKGQEVNMKERTPFYGDFTQIPTDLRECMVKITTANNAFMTLDAQVRFRFGNDPARLLDFLNDPKNREEAVKLGLVAAPVEVPKDEALETLKSIDSSLKSGVSGAKKSKPKADDE